MQKVNWVYDNIGIIFLEDEHLKIPKYIKINGGGKPAIIEMTLNLERMLNTEMDPM